MQSYFLFLEKKSLGKTKLIGVIIIGFKMDGLILHIPKVGAFNTCSSCPYMVAELKIVVWSLSFIDHVLILTCNPAGCVIRHSSIPLHHSLHPIHKFQLVAHWLQV
jgi:hypothetical protein